MSKGASSAAEKLQAQTNAEGLALDTTATNLQNSELIPYYTQAMQSPTGLGATALGQELTSSGQSIGGTIGAANKAGMDMAARVGNWGAVPSIINNNARAGANAMSNNAMDVNLKNRIAQLSQSQSGAAGLSGISNADLQGAIGMYGQTNNAIGNWVKSDAETQAALMSDIQIGASLASGAMTGGMAAMPGAGSGSGSGGGGLSSISTGSWAPEGGTD